MVGVSSRGRSVAIAILCVTMLSMPGVPAGAVESDIPAYDGAPDTALLSRYHSLELSNGRLFKSTERIQYQPRSFAPGTDVDADPFSAVAVGGRVPL